MHTHAHAHTLILPIHLQDHLNTDIAPRVGSCRHVPLGEREIPSAFWCGASSSSRSAAPSRSAVPRGLCDQPMRLSFPLSLYSSGSRRAVVAFCACMCANPSLDYCGYVCMYVCMYTWVPCPADCPALYLFPRPVILFLSLPCQCTTDVCVCVGVGVRLFSRSVGQVVVRWGKWREENGMDEMGCICLRVCASRWGPRLFWASPINRIRGPFQGVVVCGLSLLFITQPVCAHAAIDVCVVVVLPRSFLSLRTREPTHLHTLTHTPPHTSLSPHPLIHTHTHAPPLSLLQPSMSQRDI